ncbi:glycosyltransferase family 2 protein [Syntrophus aciditrophicus]|uniref:Glycosyltransferase n=1 Tax=Syntrophus aciditrophicus (strain SB) TaxID=56780 RepID=Q2LWP0_SYNAS|nr:glycosyltransferase family A protein [Syntrophus aciditrophicus]ABC78500.1 glycosyltransferase [Syntrophus aciditrophicus SB]
MKRLFIGMPVFNGETYISKALDSIIKQSFCDWQLLIADNYSSDGTERIAMEYVTKDTRIKYIQHPSNIGALNNFIFLVNEAESDYFMWAAADDEWSSNFLELCVKTLDSCRDVQFVSGNVANIDLSGTILRKYDGFSVFDDKWIWRRLVKYLCAPEILGKANMIYSVYRIGFCRELCGIPNVLSGWGADMTFVFAGLARGHYKYIPDITLFKRVLSESDIDTAKIAAHNNFPMLQFFGWFPITHYREYRDGYYKMSTNNPIRLIVLLIMKYRVLCLWLRLKIQSASSFVTKWM